MAIDGQTFENQTFGPYYTFGDGNTFKNCTFKATVWFGKGNVFINCKWVRCCYPYYSNYPSVVQDGGVVDGGFWDRVIFAPNVTLKSGGGGSFSMGSGTTRDAAPKKKGRGGEWFSSGQIVTGNDYLDMGAGGAADCGCQGEWDKEVLEKGYKIIGDDGTAEVTVPSDTITCGDKK